MRAPALRLIKHRRPNHDGDADSLSQPDYVGKVASYGSAGLWRWQLLALGSYFLLCPGVPKFNAPTKTYTSQSFAVIEEDHRGDCGGMLSQCEQRLPGGHLPSPHRPISAPA